MSPRPALAEFATAILRLDIERYRSTRADSNPVFFDRGIIDAWGMLDQLGLLTESETRQYLLDYPYSRRVFVLPPWEQIYTGDSERDQTFADSVRCTTMCANGTFSVDTSRSRFPGLPWRSAAHSYFAALGCRITPDVLPKLCSRVRASLRQSRPQFRRALSAHGR